MRRRIDSYVKIFENNTNNRTILTKLTKSLRKQVDIFYGQTIAGYQLSDLIMPPNHLLIHEVALNALADIARIKSFHPVEHPTRYKYAAYVCYWWLRIKPLYPQIHSEKEAGLIAGETIKTVPYALMTSVNEIFLCDFIMSMTGRLIKDKTCTEYAKISDSFIDLQDSLLYFMQYRLFTAQQLEMYLKAINVCPMAYLLES